ncbi:MAG: carboxypeptidase-like regulatory domain-containing protein [Tannerellaceae bacterium]|jgi:hypothetical protein|nr:carboxypeptidase-like regulatory domain-containing protein [Tannerellaceae bacterium]
MRAPKYWTICCLAWLTVSAAYALQADNGKELERKIKLPKSEGTVYELLEKVSQRSGYLFIYDNSVLNNEQHVSLKKGEYTIRQAIREITGNRHLLLRIIGNHILIQSPNSPTLPVPPRDTADGYFTVNGTLLDRYTREPVAYATVGINDNATGTVANLNGDFRLRLPDSLSHASVRFDHIGYLAQEFEARLIAGQARTFLVEPKVISIQEVVVRLANPLRLLHDMMDNRAANYSSGPVYFTSFYREGVERSKGFVNLVEAVFKIYKTPYGDRIGADQVKLLKMRRISNEKVQDTIVAKMKSGVDASLMLDMIKNPPEFLLPENENQYNYFHGDITAIDNRIANMISFEQRKDVKEPLYRGELFIDAENGALLSARFEIHPKYIEKATPMLVTRKSKNLHIDARQVVYNVSYKPWNGTYYVSHIRGDLFFRVRKRNQIFGSTTIHTWFEMATCKIETDGVTRFAGNETLRTRTIFADTDFAADPSFWGDFNIILPEEKLSEAIGRITSKIEETGY